MGISLTSIRRHATHSNSANTFNYRDFYPSWALKTIEDTAIPTALAKAFWAGDIAMLCADGEEIPVSQMLISHRQ